MDLQAFRRVLRCAFQPRTQGLSDILLRAAILLGFILSSLRHRIRQLTASKHAALESTALMQSFAADRLSMPVYRSYLLLQWRLHVPLEIELARWLPGEWAGLRLRKSEWLLQDLQAMGGRATESLESPCVVESWAQALGMLYVLEGSTMGLQVVRKQLQLRHPEVQLAGRFMLGYGPDTGRHWREFLAHLESLDAVDWPQAELAACATFDHFLGAFSKVE
jgi:heme oxygenase